MAVGGSAGLSRMSGDFLLAPNAVLRDERLSKIQLKVLLTLFSFRDNKTTKPIYAKRETIAARCGYSTRIITRTTSELEALGWITKTGNGGRSSPCLYELHAPETVPDSDEVYTVETVAESDRVLPPETVAESGTVPESETVSESGQNGIRIGSETVAESDRGNKQTITNHKNKPIGDWVNPDAWAEFEEHRRQIEKPLTDLSRQKAMNTLQGYTFAEQQHAIDKTIQNRWTGLFPEKLGGANGTSKRITHADDIRSQAARALAALDARNGTAGGRAIRSDSDVVSEQVAGIPDL